MTTGWFKVMQCVLVLDFASVLFLLQVVINDPFVEYVRNTFSGYRFFWPLGILDISLHFLKKLVRGKYIHLSNRI
jgi:hypothetical protein